jgi:uncharacterized repeat protein (TIGR02543 family)
MKEKISMRKNLFSPNRLWAVCLVVVMMLTYQLPFAVQIQAAGTPQLDQRCEVADSYGGFSSFYTGQSFTAGRTGVLSQVDLLLKLESYGQGEIMLQIVEADASGYPTSNVLGYSKDRQVISGVAGSNSWYSFTFDQMARVQAGKRYVIIMNSTTDNVLLNGKSTTGAGPYTAGNTFVKHFFAGAPWSQGTATNYDYAFRTYVSSPSSNASLNNLVLENGQLYDTFDSNITEYTAWMAMEQTSLKITPSLFAPTGATITVDGKVCKNGATQTVSVPTDRDIPIIVTAENGTTTKTYTLKVAHSYTVGFSPLLGGSIQASPLVKKQGTPINLNITPDLYKRLKPGSLKYNDGTGDYPISASSFLMPAADVTVSAIFLDDPQTLTRTTNELFATGVTSLYVNSQEGYILATDRNNRKLYSVDTNNCQVEAAFTVNDVSARNAVGIVQDAITKRIYILNNESKNISEYDIGNLNVAANGFEVQEDPRGLTLNSALNRLYVVNKGSNSISIMDSITRATLNIGVGIGPIDMALDTITNKIYVANSGSNDVTVLDGLSGAVLGMVPVGNEPSAIAVDSATQRVYVANAGSNNVTVINTADYSVVSTVSAGATPYAIEINPNNHKIYVANSSGNTLTVIDGSNFDIATVPVGNGPRTLAVNPNNNVIYVLNTASQSVTAVDENERTITYAVGSAPADIAVDTKTNRVYVANSGSNDIITELPALIPETLTVSNPTVSGVTVVISPEVETLTATNFILRDSVGNTVTVLDATTADLGSTYQISAALKDGQTYSITAVCDGYTFGGFKSFTVPLAPVKTYNVNIGTFTGGTIQVAPSTTVAGETVYLTITPDNGKQLKPGTLKYNDGTTDTMISGTSFIMPPTNVTVSAEFKDISPSITNADKVAADKEALSIGYAIGDNANCVTKNLNLTVTGAVYGSSITWVSDNTNVISNSGIVTRPTYISGDAAVTVTAAVYNASVSDAKVFNLVVLKLPETIYTITFNKNGGDTPAIPNTQTVVSGGNLGTLPIAPTRSGYTFNGWNTTADGTGTAYMTATAVNADLTLYAQWTVISNGGSSSGNGGSSSDNGGSSSDTGGSVTGSSTSTPTETASTTTVTHTTTVSSGVTSTITAQVKSDSNASATATVSENQIKEAIRQAVAEATKQKGGIPVKVEINIPAVTEAKTMEVSFPKSAVTALADNQTDALILSTPLASITFDKAAMATISKQAVADVKFTASRADASGLSEAAKALVADRPVFNFSVTSGDKTISQFAGTVMVSVPYTPKAGEDTNAIVINSINAHGEPNVVGNCAYDSSTGTIRFKTTNFYQYAVGYNKVNFKDVPSESWYSRAVTFLAARGIANGTGEGNYSPEDKLTRGQFLVMVMKAYEMKADENLKDNFEDSGDTYYTGYLATAKKQGITHGVGNNMFAPDKEITRQEMFALLYNMLKHIGKLPEATSQKTLLSYSDASEIESWAKDAMTLFVNTGIVSGSGDNLNPADTTNRAQMAQVLYSLLSK